MTESDTHLWLACNSPEGMVAQAQPQCTTLQEIPHCEMPYTDYDNMQSTEDVRTDPGTCNARTTLTMYDPAKESPEVCTDEKPTNLLPLRYAM